MSISLPKGRTVFMPEIPQKVGKSVELYHHLTSLQDEISKQATGLFDNDAALRDTLDTLTLTTIKFVEGYSSINAAVASIGSTPSTLIISSAVTLTANLTIPSTLSIIILKGGSIVKASTYTLTINGSFIAGLYQVFSGFSSDVTFGDGVVENVYAEWFGALNDGTSDSTAAVVTACAAAITGQATLCFQAGTYLVAGVDTYGALYSSSNRLKIRGAGQFDTIIKNTSSTGILVRLSGTACEISDLTLDNDGGEGICLRVTGQYAKLTRLIVKNQAGSNIYAVSLDGCTCATVEDVSILASDFCLGIGENNATAYVTLSVIVLEPKSGTALYIENGANLRFYGVIIEAEDAIGSGTVATHIYLTGCQQVAFHDLGMELAPPRTMSDDAYIDIVNSGSVSFTNVRIRHTEAVSKSLFQLSGAASENFSITDAWLYSTKTGMVVLDINSDASPYGTSIKNVETLFSETGTGVQNSITSYNLTIQNWVNTDAAVSHTLNAIDLCCINVMGDIALTDGARQTLINCSGDVTGTGANTCVRIPKTAETITAAGALSVRDGISILDSTSGAMAITLADGEVVGDIKTVYMSTDGGNATLTVANHEVSASMVFTFDDAGDSLTLQWAGTVWVTLHTYGVAPLVGTATWDPGAIAAGGYEAKDFTLSGATVGMAAKVGPGRDVADLIVSATVTAADTVTVVLFNPTGGSINIASSTWTVSAETI